MQLDVGHRDQDRSNKISKSDAVPRSADRDTSAASTDVPTAQEPAAAVDDSIPHQNTEASGAPATEIPSVSAEPKLSKQILSQLHSAIRRRPLALSYITTAVVALMFLAACWPLVHRSLTDDPQQSGKYYELLSWHASAVWWLSLLAVDVHAARASGLPVVGVGEV